jgi:hypothetical protein
MLQIAFIERKKSNQCFGKRNMEAKSSVEEVIQLDEKTPSYASRARRNSSRI